MPRINFAHTAPEALKALMGVKAYTDQGSIEPRLRALVDLRVSQINGCLYCMDMHSREARHAGETQQRLDCLPGWHEAPFFDAREKAALAWAESLTLIAGAGVSDEEFDNARAELGERELADLTVIVGMINTWNRIAISFAQVPPTRHETPATP